MDLPAMDPCPFGKRGAHHMMVITPENDAGYLTFACEACGSLRRVPATGGLVPASPLDDVDMVAIAQFFAG